MSHGQLCFYIQAEHIIRETIQIETTYVLNYFLIKTITVLLSYKYITYFQDLRTRLSKRTYTPHGYRT